MILSRSEFVAWWDGWVPENPVTGRTDHPLWFPETQIVLGPPSEWFVQTRNIDADPAYQARGFDFRAWCDQNLQGLARCYMVDESTGMDWWGFTHQDDIVFWQLRWG
jgi:hypothetical protein